MKTPLHLICRISLLALSSVILSQCAHEPVTQANASNASGAKIAADSRAALQDLYAKNAAARRLGKQASGVLVFPHILKGGFVVGAEGGNGALLGADGSVRGYYQTAAASYGLQAGVEKFGYALFLMDSKEVANLNQAAGWSVGTSPSLVVVDRGLSAELTTKTVDRGTYAFIFDQRGLMGGVSLKGSKITRIKPGS
ncbi:YSC84-related protein [Luteolibacter sp. GHJ8]|uniref:YSC84-related protein n=1 Tax=Luteolibacter rhizosphaerae TaxID=2989719 RepID=A0ABT3GBT1_9BACT|nr:YSC84-related protein [Luteolibacter rhizosphaerae]MCW1916934.1 YSC84-related protein [Luteolibacter rhizosphaerae]